MSTRPLASSSPAPRWFWLAAVLGLAWNVFGVVQFVSSVRSTPESLMEMGMTPEQAQVYASYPIWMTVAFAIGVFGGVVGCVLLLARKKLAAHVFAASLAGYVVLYVGDITEGVFVALGAEQVIVLSLVVAIAALLLWFSRHFTRTAHLT
jgi:hypothetical protein